MKIRNADLISTRHHEPEGPVRNLAPRRRGQFHPAIRGLHALHNSLRRNVDLNGEHSLVQLGVGELVAVRIEVFLVDLELAVLLAIIDEPAQLAAAKQAAQAEAALLKLRGKRDDA